MKIKVNENLTSIINYVHDYENEIGWFHLVQYCIDYGMYKELFLNYHIINKLIEEHNHNIRTDQEDFIL